MVLQDVLDEYVSVERASKDYGVVIDKDKNSIDIKATNELRKKLRQEKNK
jgi:N-methylhydantoinase B